MQTPARPILLCSLRQPSSNARMGDPPAETGGTTHPAQEVEKAGVKEEPKSLTEATGGQHTGVVLEPQAASQPSEVPQKVPLRPCHLPGLPCGLWWSRTGPSGFTWSFPTCAGLSLLGIGGSRGLPSLRPKDLRSEPLPCPGRRKSHGGEQAE